MEMKKAVVVGGGMAGCEAAQIIASYGIDVDLYEQKPVNFSAMFNSAFRTHNSVTRIVIFPIS